MIATHVISSSLEDFLPNENKIYFIWSPGMKKESCNGTVSIQAIGGQLASLMQTSKTEEESARICNKRIHLIQGVKCLGEKKRLLQVGYFGCSVLMAFIIFP